MILQKTLRQLRAGVMLAQAQADALCTHQPNNHYATRARAALADAYANLGRAINELDRGNVANLPKPRKGVTHVPQRPDKSR